MTTTITAKKHAVLGPSGWDWWSSCPGGPVLAEGLPRTTSVYAAWGTVAHEIAAACLTDNADAEEFVGKVYESDGHRIECDMEMADCINEYIAQVRVFVPEGDVLMVEQEVPIGHLTGETDATGTADVIGIINEGTRLVVIDLKTGRGVQVDAEGNGQGRMYALGALKRYGLIYEDIAEVEIVIVQPRLDHVTSELLTLEELRAFADEVTLAAGRVELARDFRLDVPPQYLNPGEKQCKFCDAKGICPALGNQVSSSMALVSAASPEEFEDLTLPKRASSLLPAAEVDNEKLAAAFRAIPLIEEWVKGVGAEIDRRLLEGQAIPGLYLGEGKKGRREWADPLKAEAELKRRYKVDEMYEKKVISPTKAEKLMKDKPRVWAKVVQEVGILQPDGKPRVCIEGVDKNPVYRLTSPDDFPDLTDLTDPLANVAWNPELVIEPKSLTDAPVEAQDALSLMDD